MGIAKKIETANAGHIKGLEYALVCLGAWLLAYITWWVFAERLEKEKS